MHLRLWSLSAVGVVMLVTVPATASFASIGVGVQAGPVRLPGDAHPGGSYALPPVYVVNTGTQAESVAVRIERISPGRGRTVPPSWVRATGPAVQLSHDQSARIPLELAIPASARPGRYFSDVVVRGSGTLSAGTANLGVAAATSLEFTVAPGVISGSWLGLPAWTWLAICVLLVLAAAIAGVRYSGWRIRVERRSVGGDVSEGDGRADLA